MKKMIMLTLLQSFICLSSYAQTQVRSSHRTLIAYMKVVPGTEARFLQLAQNVIKESRRESGNLIYILQQSVKQPNQFVFYEVFKTDADLELHRNSSHVKEFLQKTKPIVLPGMFLLEKYQNLMTLN